MKVHVGAHIDGFAAVSAETLVVGASASEPVTGRKADVLRAAWTAAEAAMRLVKVGNKNWTVTETVGKIADAWGCKPVEGMRHILRGGSSHDFEQVCSHASRRRMSLMARSALFSTP